MDDYLEETLAELRLSTHPTAVETVEFLTGNPTPQEILAYHASEQGQNRVRQLLALNSAGLAGEAEEKEMDELERIEHIVIMLKAQMLQQEVNSLG